MQTRGSVSWEQVGVDCDPRNEADLICADHCVETVWYAEKQFAFESGTQFGQEVASWNDITTWTRSQLYDWLGY